MNEFLEGFQMLFVYLGFYSIQGAIVFACVFAWGYFSGRNLERYGNIVRKRIKPRKPSKLPPPPPSICLMLLAFPSVAFAQDEFNGAPFRMEVPGEIRYFYRNPDGSCVQCSIGMCGIWQDEPKAYTLLWDSIYGEAERGGSWASRVEKYAKKREMAIYNVTGEETFKWMEWAAKTGRFAAIGAGSSHFQTLAGFDPKDRTWYVCNNNSPKKIDRYTDAEFRRLHLASGPWIVILDDAPPAVVPRYVNWWQ